MSNYRRHLVHNDVKCQIIDTIWYTIIVNNRGKILVNTSATSCDCEIIQSSSLRIILFPQLLEIFSERNGFIVLKNFLLSFCLSHRCRKYVLIEFMCNLQLCFAIVYTSPCIAYCFYSWNISLSTYSVDWSPFAIHYSYMAPGYGKQTWFLEVHVHLQHTLEVIFKDIYMKRNCANIMSEGFIIAFSHASVIYSAFS